MSREATAPPELVIPQHVGIIMDGNGRWAQKRGLPRLAGHRAGTENIRRVLEACVEFGIPVVTLYAFSTENWGRPPEEVRGLLALLERSIDRETEHLHRNGVQIRHIGRTDRLGPHFCDKIAQAVALTRNNRRLILNVALDYGGRAEIVDAVRRVVSDGVPAEAIDEALFSRHLYTSDLPDPDLIIRTAGEMRLSNFLIWQAAYAEYYSTPTYWPDFDREELLQALKAFTARERRFGLVKQT